MAHQESATPKSAAGPDNKRPRTPATFRLQRFLSRRLPGLIRNPYVKADLEWHRARDAEENRKTTPADNQRVDIYCLWAAEVYTPSHAEDLVSAFTALGWDKKGVVSTRDSAVEWLRHARAAGHGGGWMNLGRLVRPNEVRNMFGYERPVSLPDGVKYANAYLFNLTSSVTCLVIGFVFTEEFGRRFDDALRKDRTTSFRMRGRGYTILEPEHQKQEDIASMRRDMHIATANWFRKNVPGVFSKGEELAFPTCEFMVLENLEPFPVDDDKQPYNPILEILGVGHFFDTWESEDNPSQKFTWPLLSQKNEPFYAALITTLDGLSKIESAGYPPERDGYVEILSNRMRALISRWACLALLNLFERRLNSVRDSKTFRSLGSKPLKLLTKLGDILVDSVDIATVCPELKSFAENSRLFDYEISEFKLCRPRPAKEPIRFRKFLRDGVISGAVRLHAMDRNIKDLLMNQGTLAGAYENIRLQKWISALTVALLLLTAILAYESLSKVDLSDVGLTVRNALVWLTDKVR